MSSAQPEQSRLMQTTVKFIDAYNTWDLKNIMPFRSDDCVNHIIPMSLGHTEMSNDEYANYLGAFMPAFQNFHVKIVDVMEDQRQNKVSLWIQSTAQSIIGPYANEYMLFLTFDAKHEKVVKFVEFVDSKYSTDYFTKLREIMQAKAKEVKAKV